MSVGWPGSISSAIVGTRLWRFSTPLMFQHACKMGLEGIVSKRAGGFALPSDRTPDWPKFKNPQARAVKREAEEDPGTIGMTDRRLPELIRNLRVGKFSCGVALAFDREIPLCRGLCHGCGFCRLRSAPGPSVKAREENLRPQRELGNNAAGLAFPPFGRHPHIG